MEPQDAFPDYPHYEAAEVWLERAEAAWDDGHYEKAEVAIKIAQTHHDLHVDVEQLADEEGKDKPEISITNWIAESTRNSPNPFARARTRGEFGQALPFQRSPRKVEKVYIRDVGPSVPISSITISEDENGSVTLLRHQVAMLLRQGDYRYRRTQFVKE